MFNDICRCSCLALFSCQVLLPRNTEDDINYGIVHTHISYGIRLLFGGEGGGGLNKFELSLNFKNVRWGYFQILILISKNLLKKLFRRSSCQLKPCLYISRCLFTVDANVCWPIVETSTSMVGLQETEIFLECTTKNRVVWTTSVSSGSENN